MRHTRITIAALAITGLLALTGCGGNDSSGSSKDSSEAPATAQSSDTELDAEQVVTRIAEAIDSAKPATVYTAETDPNNLLGRPSGYESKADFTDSRAKPELDDEVQQGGSVEVFDDPADAKDRGKFIADTLKKMKIFGTEYHYTKGGILLRVSGELTPDQAAEYEEALDELG